jgi:hypothetical protein
MRSFLPLFFQGIVPSFDTHALGHGTWNVSRSSNPVIWPSTLIHVSQDHSFELINSPWKVSGRYDTKSLPYIDLWVTGHKLPVPLKVAHIDDMSRRLYIEHGMYEYVFERVSSEKN